jgi:hypothetical protein
MEEQRIVSPEESYRIHLDWWGKCRTCTHWEGPREKSAPRTAKCSSASSDRYGLRSTWDGYCPEWDSFDTDTALQVMEDDLSK